MTDMDDECVQHVMASDIGAVQVNADDMSHTGTAITEATATRRE